MDNTENIMDSIIAKLSRHFGRDVEVEYYPEKPAKYRLNHPQGALLLNYGSASYGETDDTNPVIQDRNIVYVVTVVSRQLHGKDGALKLLGKTRAVLRGYKPMHCTVPLTPIKDFFLQQVSGLWMYALEIKAQTVELQDAQYNPAVEF